MNDPATALDFLVGRQGLRQTKFVPAPGPSESELQPGQVQLAIDKFGFTANNVTYAAFGDAMRYWDFFPGPEGWGRIPVWGYAGVARSAHDAITEGERVFGYLPMSTHVVVQPDWVTEAGFVDGFPHRAGLPGVYQRYLRTAGDPRYEVEHEDQQALWRPLFMTSFGTADFLAENGLFGAQAVAFSSASSKTALGTAFLLSRSRPSQCEVIGLTSPGNVAFCERLGYYDRVLAYEGLESLSRDTPTVLVDLAGAEKLRRDLSDHLGNSLKQTVLVGATQWEEREAGGGLGAPDAQFFFLPTWIEKRREDWGPREFGGRYQDAWGAFLPSVGDWMKVVYAEGPAAVEAVYREMLEGKVNPEVGHILSLKA